MTGDLHNPFGDRVYTAYGYYPEAAREGQLAFTGQWLDGGARGYLLGNGFRLFSSELMRFTGPDTLSPFGKGGANGYSYCKGDPVGCIDPSGRSAVSAAFKFLRLKPKTGLSKMSKLSGLGKRLLRGQVKELEKKLLDPTATQQFVQEQSIYVLGKYKGKYWLERFDSLTDQPRADVSFGLRPEISTSLVKGMVFLDDGFVGPEKVVLQRSGPKKATSNLGRDNTRIRNQ